MFTFLSWRCTARLRRGSSLIFTPCSQPRPWNGTFN